MQQNLNKYQNLTNYTAKNQRQSFKIQIVILMCGHSHLILSQQTRKSKTECHTTGRTESKALSSCITDQLTTNILSFSQSQPTYSDAREYPCDGKSKCRSALQRAHTQDKGSHAHKVTQAFKATYIQNVSASAVVRRSRRAQGRHVTKDLVSWTALMFVRAEDSGVMMLPVIWIPQKVSVIIDSLFIWDRCPCSGPSSLCTSSHWECAHCAHFPVWRWPVGRCKVK